jgi:hypothetical protein
MWAFGFGGISRAIRTLSTVVMIASGLASSLNPSVERSNPPMDKWCLIPRVKFYIDISSIRETRGRICGYRARRLGI